MKICVSDKKRFLPRYFIFCILLSFLLFLFFIFTSYSNQKSGLPSDMSDLMTENTKNENIVIIDAGHGGEDCGAVGENGIYEKDINLSIAQTLSDMLQAHGIKTVMTRNEDILLYDKNSDHHGQKKVQDLATRRKIAQSYESAIFVSIHMNAFPESKYSGLQVYYSANDPTSKELAQRVQDITRTLIAPDNNRKIKQAGSNIYLLDRLTQPAVLIECGFLSNPEECALLSSEEYREKMAFSIYFAIISHFKKVNNFNV